MSGVQEKEKERNPSALQRKIKERELSNLKN
nr:MAG TPA: hypothetical protein [Caudoviricetes sp.]